MTDLDLASLQIVHNPAASRFEIDLGEGQFGVVEYDLRDNALTIHHTGVPTAFENQGIAARMTKFALDWAKAEGYKVIPLCSYTRAYMLRHPEG
jgi:hypothetical protein